MYSLPNEAVKKFWQLTSKRGEDECWPFLYKDGCDYGRFMLDGVMYKAHQFSYELHFGVRGDKETMHLCNNKCCVNPKHLKLGTHKENLKHAAVTGRMNQPRRRFRLSCNKGHPLTRANTYITTAGDRVCWECKNARQRKCYAAKKLATKQ